MGYLGGIHYWWPKISGRLYPDRWARLASVLIFLGFHLTFFPHTPSTGHATTLEDSTSPVSKLAVTSST